MKENEHLIGIASLLRERSALLLDLERVLKEMEERTDRLLSELPRSTSVFHNVVDAMAAYRMLCPYLLLLEKKKRILHEATLVLASLRDQAAKRFVDLSVWSADYDDTQAESARRAFQRFVAQADALSEALGRFMRIGMRQYLQALDEASDGEHDGKDCNVMKIGIHGRTFCDRIAELLSMIEEQKS